jgi:hypothetical protein
MSTDKEPGQAFLDDLFSHLRRMPVPEQPADKDLLARLASAQPFASHEENTLEVRSSHSSKRRYLMRVLIPSAAAALLFVALGWLFLNDTPALALGDVIEAAKKHKLVKYKHKQTDTPRDGLVASLEQVVYADLKALRFRSESRNKFQDPDDREKFIEEINVAVQDSNKGRMLMTNTHPGGKLLPPRKEATLLGSGEERTKPKSFLENLQEFQQRKGVTSVKDKLDGREMMRFRLEEDNTTTSLWVEVKTKLPYRLEWELVTANATHKFVDTDYEWDPPLPKGSTSLDSLFSTQPPEGYQVKDRTKEKGPREGEPAKAP